MATVNGKSVSVKLEHFHLPAKEDRMAEGPPTDQKIDPAFSSNCGTVHREEHDKNRFCFAAKT